MKIHPKRALAVLAAVLAVAVLYDVSRGMSPGPDVKDFTIDDIHGRPWSLAGVRGHHPVLLCFFSTTCGPCQMEFPHLVELVRAHQREGLQLVMLTAEGPDVLASMGAPPASGPVTILPSAQPVFERYGVDAIPHVILYDAHGAKVVDAEGYDPTEGTRRLAQALEPGVR